MTNTPDNATPHTRPKGLTPVLAVSFADNFGYTIVMPFMVFLVTQWGGNAFVYALVSATYPAFQLFGAPLLGRLSETWGYKRVLALSEAGSLLSWLIVLAGLYLPMVTIADVSLPTVGKFAVTLPLVMLFAGRALDGLTGGNVAVANAYVGDISTREQRSTNFGKLSASSNIGGVLGPGVASLMAGAALGYALPVTATAVVCLAATLFVLFGLPSTARASKSITLHPTRSALAVGTGHGGNACAAPPPKVPMSVILRIPGVTPLLSASFLINLAFNIFYIALPMYGVGVLAWSPLEVSLFFVTMSAVMVFFEGPGLRRVTAVCNTAALVAISGLILGAGFLLLASHSTVVVLGGAMLIGMGNGLMWPLLMSLMAMRAGDHQGAVQGVAGGGGALAGIIGLILGGIMYARLEGMLFVVAAVPVFVVMILALGAERRHK